MTWISDPIGSDAASPGLSTASTWNGDPIASQTPPPSLSTAAPSLFNTDEIARNITFGLSDKAAAMGSAVGAVLPGSAHPGGFWDTYSQRLSDLRNQAQAYSSAHPIASVVGPLAGGMMSAPASAVAAIPSLGRAIGQSAKAGGVVGGLAGLGQSDDTAAGTARDVGLGAAGGAAFGAAVPPLIEAGRPVLEGFQRLLPWVFPGAVANQALRRVQQSVGQDVAAGGPGAPDMMAQLALTPNKPMGLADVGGENLRALAGSVARAPGAGRQVASSFFSTRDADAGARLIGDIDAGISSGGNAYDTVQSLMQQRAQTAAPLYDRALNAGTTYSPRLQQFLDDPVLRQGLAQGIEVQRLESLAQGRPFNPSDYTVVYPTGTPGNIPELMGAPSFAPTPNMRTLDAAKRGLDNMLDQYRDSTTGRLVLDQRGRAIDQVRQAYLGELDRLNPDYAAARSAWSGPSQSMDVISQGQNFAQMRPEQIRDLVGNMGAGDRQFFLLGVADKLRSDVLRTATNGDEAKRLINNQYVQQQLRPLFQNQDAFDSFANAVTAERTMYGTQGAVMGGSQTAGRLAEDTAGHGGGTLGSLVAGGAAVLAHEPFAAVPMLMRGVRGAYGAMTQPSDALREELARRLFNPNEAVNQRFLQQVDQMRQSAGVRPLLIAPGATALGRLGPNSLVREGPRRDPAAA